MGSGDVAAGDVGAGDVGAGAGDVAAGEIATGDTGPAVPTTRGGACVRAVVVTGPAELPFSQADQDFCQ